MKKLEDMYVARTGQHCRNLLRHEIDMDAERSRKEAGLPRSLPVRRLVRRCPYSLCYGINT